MLLKNLFINGRQYTLGNAKANISPSTIEMIITGKKKFEWSLIRSVIIRVI